MPSFYSRSKDQRTEAEWKHILKSSVCYRHTCENTYPTWVTVCVRRTSFGESRSSFAWFQRSEIDIFSWRLLEAKRVGKPQQPVALIEQNTNKQSHLHRGHVCFSASYITSSLITFFFCRWRLVLRTKHSLLMWRSRLQITSQSINFPRQVSVTSGRLWETFGSGRTTSQNKEKCKEMHHERDTERVHRLNSLNVVMIYLLLG